MTDAPDPTPELSREPARLLTGERAGYAALAVSVVALALAAAPYVVGGGPVRDYLLKHPEVLQEASAALESKGQQAQADAITERAAANPALLAIDATDPAFGPKDARVTVMEFFDFRCPGCKATAPEVLRLMQAHPDVRFVFMDWPILDRGQDDVSHYAARAAQAAHAQGKYLPVFRALMAEPALSREAVDRILAANGVTGAEAVMASPATARHLATIDAAGAALQLYGTPTFFVNGRAQASINPVDLERAIQQAKAGRLPPPTRPTAAG
jgi:protein-disulfide isomerase